MTDLLALEAVQAALGGFGPVTQLRSNRIQVVTGAEKARDAIRSAYDGLSCERLIMISTADLGRTFQLTYHLTGLHRTVISIRIEIPRENPAVPTVSDLLPPAGI